MQGYFYNIMQPDPEILQNSPIENRQGNENIQKYQPVELGDTNGSVPVPQINPPVQNNPNPAQSSVTQTPADPTAFWSQVSSTGYKPSAKLIQNAANILNSGKSEWADTWFSILFQKIVKKIKYDQMKAQEDASK